MKKLVLLLILGVSLFAEGRDRSNIPYRDVDIIEQSEAYDVVCIKATYAEITRKGFDIFKAPKTDSGKNSAKGLLSVVKENNKIVTKQQCTKEQESQGLLECGYVAGVFLEEKPDFQEMRARAQSNL